MGAARVVDTAAVRQGRVITGRAAGSAFDFGLTLIEALQGPDAYRQIAAEVVYS